MPNHNPDDASASLHPRNFEHLQAFFDDTHGQTRWRDTGFMSREIQSNFSEVANALAAFGIQSVSVRGRGLAKLSREPHLLVVPPPTGDYDFRKQQWVPNPGALFQPEELVAILNFIQSGGRLLAFAYRFGDPFTKTNLNDLFSPLGCHLNDDAVFDLDQLRTQHPLKSQFITGTDLLPQSWSRHRAAAVAWRTMATITILPGADARPLALSPGGRCVTFDRLAREISFESRPIAVTGHFGDGRFVLVGGPHAFEAGPFGLIHTASNRQFLLNILVWLLGASTADRAADGAPGPQLDQTAEAARDRWAEFSRVQGRGRGERLVQFLERLLKKNGVLKALNKSNWAP